MREEKRFGGCDSFLLKHPSGADIFRKKARDFGTDAAQNGYCIATSHVEAAARLLAARRCKQAGMHWRVENAACVGALPARYRSSQTPAA